MSEATKENKDEKTPLAVPEFNRNKQASSHGEIVDVTA